MDPRADRLVVSGGRDHHDLSSNTDAPSVHPTETRLDPDPAMTTSFAQRTRHSLLAAFLVLGSASAASSQDLTTSWISGDFGTLDGSMISISSSGPPSSLASFDLSGPDYAAAPLFGNTQCRGYPTSESWTATFSPPISNLRLYCVSWRGAGGAPGGTNFVFDRTPVVLSGLTGGTTVTGNTVTTTDIGFHSGILEFSGPVGSLTCTSDGICCSAQALCFGSDGVFVPLINVTCDPASDHFLGDYVKLDDSSFGSGVGSDLHIDAKDGPSGEFGFLLVSSDGSANLSVFNGVLCLGNPQGRYNPQVATIQGLAQLNSLGQFDANGDLVNIVGTSNSGFGFDVPSELPFSPSGQVITPGSTLYFQCWYRDQTPPLPSPGSSANFSNVIEVTFP
tara:strand:- start:31621 stop:32796 length:1176 start_codon:yes stop_codon:yes gene_type:complete